MSSRKELLAQIAPGAISEISPISPNFLDLCRCSVLDLAHHMDKTQNKSAF
jgi:hypothetical protein